MSLMNDKEKMNNESKAFRKNVWSSIKITFVAFAVVLLAFCIVLAITMFGNKKPKGDVTKPVVSGPANGIYVGYVGETPLYKQMITVMDDTDPSPSIEVDNSQVDINTPGEYTVYYTVTDEAGNVTQYALIYSVKSAEYSPATLMALIEEKADALGITKDMTKTQQVRKIYDYVHAKNTIFFTDESNIPNINRDNWENDWVEEAILALESGEGDCYSYYALSKAFFEYFGIENKGIRRSENYEGCEEDGTHFWSVVHVEEGWFYYDATRLAGSFNDGTNNACLITEAKLKSYVGSHGETYFYNMVKPVNFPAVSTKELD